MADFAPGDIAISRGDGSCRYGEHTPSVVAGCWSGFKPGSEYLVLDVQPVPDRLKKIEPSLIDAMHLAGQKGFYCCGCFDKKAPPTLEPEVQRVAETEDA